MAMKEPQRRKGKGESAKGKLLRVALALGFISLMSGGALGQGAPAASAGGGQVVPSKAQESMTPQELAALKRAKQLKIQTMFRSEQEGIDVRIKDIARFKGVRSNQLQGIGLVVGLNGTGDSQNSPATIQMLANALNDKTMLNVAQLQPKNVALVAVTAELPPFAVPGNRIDVTVTSMTDATSLQGGLLLRTPLYGPDQSGPAYVVAMGPVSIGGFNVQRAGSSVQKNHPTTGRLPEMGIVEHAVPTQLVFDGKMYLDLQQEDFTTANRMAEQISREYPEFNATAINGGTVQVSLPPGVSDVQAMSEIEEIHFLADTPATVVIDENTGTIVMGGNVRIGPAVVAKGSLTVKIQQDVVVSQPLPFTNGTTQSNPVANVQANEEDAHVTAMGPTTSVADLATIFGALKVSATDIIAILEALRDQGALKATLKIQ